MADKVSAFTIEFDASSHRFDNAPTRIGRDNASAVSDRQATIGLRAKTH
jgi:hypothetical protein